VANIVSDSGAIERPVSSVLEDHLQVDRQRDHRAAERDVLQELRRDAELEQVGLEEVGIEEGRLALALAPDEPARE
jgi:hypothetical protein